jgi:hypothetical protein
VPTLFEISDRRESKLSTVSKLVLRPIQKRACGTALGWRNHAQSLLDALCIVQRFLLPLQISSTDTVEVINAKGPHMDKEPERATNLLWSIDEIIIALQKLRERVKRLAEQEIRSGSAS